MKTPSIAIVALSILLSAYNTTAQSINCDLFTVSDIAPDEFDVNNTLINIQMAGEGSDFANYPLVASVTDCNGDTVATGAMFFFGQIGGTEQSYPVSAFSDNVCLPLTIEFVYGNDLFETDTCFLEFGSTDVSIKDDLANPLHVYPNPTRSNVQLNYPHMHMQESYLVYDQLGKLIQQGIINTTNMQIDMGNYGPGIYLLRVENDAVKVVKE